MHSYTWDADIFWWLEIGKVIWTKTEGPFKWIEAAVQMWRPSKATLHQHRLTSPSHIFTQFSAGWDAHLTVKEISAEGDIHCTEQVYECSGTACLNEWEELQDLIPGFLLALLVAVVWECGFVVAHICTDVHFCDGLTGFMDIRHPQHGPG